jgi:hypothetical protein
VKNLYPTYRGKTEDGQVIMDMVDRFGRTWSTGVGADRVQAQYDARHKMPPKGIIRGVLSYAKSHPIRTAVLTAVACQTWKYVNHKNDDDFQFTSISDFLITTAVIYVGIKILGWFVKDE